MNSKELQERTKRFSVQVIKFADTLNQQTSSHVLSKQIIRSATSIGANYRSACIARSNAEFAAKLQIAREEADETLYWPKLLKEITNSDETDSLAKECNELVAIITSSLKTILKKINLKSAI